MLPLHELDVEDISVSHTSQPISNNSSIDEIVKNVQTSIQQKNFKRAISYQELLLQVCCDVYGHDDIKTLSVMFTLAGLLIQDTQQNADASEDLYLNTITILKANSKINDDIEWKELLGNCILSLGRLIETYYEERLFESRELYAEALRIYRQIHGECHPRTADALLHQAALFAKLRDYELAKVRCEQAYKIFARLGETSLAEFVKETLANIVKKHVKYLQNEDLIAEASVISDQMLSEEVLGCPIISGYVTIDTHNSSQHVKSKTYMAIFPTLFDDDPKIRISWCSESDVRAFRDAESSASESIWGAVKSILEDTRVGRLLSIRSSSRNGSDSFGSATDLKSRCSWMNITVESISIIRDVSMSASFGVNVVDSGLVGCLIHGIGTSGLTIPSQSSLRNTSKTEQSIHPELQSKSSTSCSLTIWFESIDDANNWQDAIRPYINQV